MTNIIIIVKCYYSLSNVIFEKKSFGRVCLQRLQSSPG